ATEVAPLPDPPPFRRRGRRWAVHIAIVGGISVGVLVEAPAAFGTLGALPARRAVARAEMGHLVETRRRVGAAEAALGFRHLDVGLRQLVEEARGDVRRPQPVHAAVGGEIDLGAPARAGEPDMGEPALLLEPGAA